MVGTVGRKIILVVPELPNMRLGTNNRRRLSWQEEARLTQEENERWYWLLSRAWDSGGYTHSDPTRFQRARIVWKLTYPTRRIPDEDNVRGALKPIQDTLLVARPQPQYAARYYLGLLMDDRPAHLVSTTMTQRYERGVSETSVTLEEDHD